MKARRQSIYVEGLEHGSLPIPTGCRIGPFVVTGGIRGVDRSTGTVPADVALQAQLMFENIAIIMEASGVGCESILRVTIWLADPASRSSINEPWTQMFPHPSSRPTRHILIHDLPANLAMQCEVFAIDCRDTFD